MLEIQTLSDTANLDIEIALDAFDGDFLPGIADREIDFAESPDTDTSLDGVTIERS
jgi:hypothetical protein